MFIMWGTRPMSKNYGRTSKLFTCTNCHNETEYNIVAHKVFFTLYFIPTFPLKIDRRLECPICGYGFDVPKENFKEILKYEQVG